MWRNILFVGAGSFIGGALRYYYMLALYLLGSVLIGVGLVAAGYYLTK